MNSMRNPVSRSGLLLLPLLAFFPIAQAQTFNTDAFRSIGEFPEEVSERRFERLWDQLLESDLALVD